MPINEEGKFKKPMNVEDCKYEHSTKDGYQFIHKFT